MADGACRDIINFVNTICTQKHKCMYCYVYNKCTTNWIWKHTVYNIKRF